MLCDRWNKTPDEIEQCDVARMLRVVEETELYRALKKMQAGGKMTAAEQRSVGDVLRLDLERK